MQVLQYQLHVIKLVPNWNQWCHNLIMLVSYNYLSAKGRLKTALKANVFNISTLLAVSKIVYDY